MPYASGHSASMRMGGVQNPGFGRTMGGGFWGMSGRGRGPPAMSMTNKFMGQSFNNRLSNSGGMGQFGRDSSLAKINDFPLQQVLQDISMTINRTCGKQPAEDFFYEYDAYAGRHFEDWELAIIFQLNENQLQHLMRIDDDGQGMIPIGVLFDQLYSMVPSLNILNINRRQQSMWDEKKKRMSPMERNNLIELAELIKNKVGNNSYMQAWRQIMSDFNQDPNSPVMNIDTLFEMVADIKDNQINQEQLNNFLNYIVLGRNLAEITQIGFVRSLQCLSPDTLTRAASASPDLGVATSIDRMTGFSGLEPTTLNEMLLRVPERGSSRPIHQYVIRVAEEL